MPFDVQPTLEGRLLTLRPLAASDFQELRAVASDPLIWEQHPAKERAESAGFRSFFDESLASGGALVVIDASTGRIVGSSRVDGFDERAREVEIGWTFLARVPVRRPGRLPRRSPERSVPASDGEDRRRTGGTPAGSGERREPRLRDHRTRLVDELTHSFTHTVEMPWILAGVPPTGKRVELAVTVVVEFEDGKSAGERIYRDQAPCSRRWG